MIEPAVFREAIAAHLIIIAAGIPASDIAIYDGVMGRVGQGRSA